LGAHVRKPAKVLYAESAFDEIGLDKLADRATEMYSIASELVYKFQIRLTAEGVLPDDEIPTRLTSYCGPPFQSVLFAFFLSTFLGKAQLDQIQPGWELR